MHRSLTIVSALALGVVSAGLPAIAAAQPAASLTVRASDRARARCAALANSPCGAPRRCLGGFGGCSLSASTIIRLSATTVARAVRFGIRVRTRMRAHEMTTTPL